MVSRDEVAFIRAYRVMHAARLMLPITGILSRCRVVGMLEMSISMLINGVRKKGDRKGEGKENDVAQDGTSVHKIALQAQCNTNRV